MNQLVASAKLGEKEAWDEIYPLMSKPIFNFMYQRTHNPEEAEDLMQEVMLKAADRIHQYKAVEGIPFSAWVFRIARNEYISSGRKNRRGPLAVNAGVNVEDVFGHGPVYEEILPDNNEEIMKNVRMAIAKLSSSEQAVINARFFNDDGEERSQEDTAEMLRITKNNVKVTQCHAVRKLRDKQTSGNNKPAVA